MGPLIFSIIQTGNRPFPLLAFARAMKLWTLYLLLLWAQSPVLFGQGAAVLSRRGDEALAAGLWEVAELHFRDCLVDPSLSPEAKSKAALRLAESLVRGGNPAEALEWLGQSWVAKNSEALFWRAQALAGQHRLNESAALFAQLLADPAAAHRREAGLSLAGLQWSLGLPEAALESLDHLIPQSTGEALVKVQLSQVEILLELKRATDARRAMPRAEAVALEDRPRAALLEAELLQVEGRSANAELAFQDLVNHPDGQSLSQFHLAAVGLADAIQAQGRTEEAVSWLLKFVQEHPDSPQVEAIFQRLLQWLPEKPSAADPILERTATWIAPSTGPTPGLIVTASSAAGAAAVSAWPTDAGSNEPNHLLAFSLYARGIGLYRVAAPESMSEARRLLKRLCFEAPSHPLANRALYQQARWLLDAGSSDQAFWILDSLRNASPSSRLKGEAAFLEARIATAKGDSKQAALLFDEASKELVGAESRSAKLQAAIAGFQSDDLKSLAIRSPRGTTLESGLEADLELERALAAKEPGTAKAALEAFLTRFPDHSRASEARLTAAEVALSETAPDLAFARTQLVSLAAMPDQFVAPFASRLALANLRLADASHDSAVTIAAAQSIIDRFPGDPAAAEAALTLGRNLFQAGSYIPARLTLEKLAAAETHLPQAQVAWLLAARAAALGGTPKSKEEALILFDKAIAGKGPVNTLAGLEKARHLIDMDRLAEASVFLRKWMATISESDPLQFPAGLLLGEALYAQGSAHPESLSEALAVYDKLLVIAKTQPTLLSRLQYLRGTTLERLPDLANPTQKREKQAFQAYHSVIETAESPVEWEYFERCGFRALALLEKSERWPAAVTLAKKIASFKGPRAEEAANHAGQLQLKHMILED